MKALLSVASRMRAISLAIPSVTSVWRLIARVMCWSAFSSAKPITPRPNSWMVSSIDPNPSTPINPPATARAFSGAMTHGS